MMTWKSSNVLKTQHQRAKVNCRRMRSVCLSHECLFLPLQRRVNGGDVSSSLLLANTRHRQQQKQQQLHLCLSSVSLQRLVQSIHYQQVVAQTPTSTARLSALQSLSLSLSHTPTHSLHVNGKRLAFKANTRQGDIDDTHTHTHTHTQGRHGQQL